MNDPQSHTPPGCGTTAEALNDACFCISLDRPSLDQALSAALGGDLLGRMRDRAPHVFAAQPVFVAPAQLERMARVIAAVERVVDRPAWREQVLAEAPSIARHDPRGVRGVFFGYDFHLEDDRLGLVEINTNAGGALLNAWLARAQRSCCRGVTPLAPGPEGVQRFLDAVVAMFRREWQLAGHQAPLRRVAIVDDDPHAQYLYPEFVLFQEVLQQAGIETLIADPGELAFRDGALHLGDAAIDLVYNRLTDFYLERNSCQALREAYLADAVVLTPHPQAYALYADKRRLVQLSDPDLLERLGIDAQTRACLAQHVPRTVEVLAQDAERLWQARRGLFFKPVSGFGSRGAYRGDKLTRRVWDGILEGGYVAQALLVPGERRTGTDEAARPMKFDLRAYAYAGEVQWMAARLYQGQTTNFRTEGGGFAPVFTTAPEAERPAPDAHQSYTFLLDDAGQVHPLPHGLYVALVHADPAPAALSGRRYRLADWYVAMHDGRPQRVVNEWYGWVSIGADGRFQPAGQAESDATALPSAAEHRRIRERLFAS